MAREEMDPSPAFARQRQAALAARAAERARRQSTHLPAAPSAWLGLVAGAAAAVVFIVAPLQLGHRPPPPVIAEGTPRPVPRLPRMVIELGPSGGDRVPYVVQDPAGIPVSHGELHLGQSYVLETIPANAVVVDTF
jgi:hypothetical protein